MQTDVTPHDTDQNEETAMNINPNHGNNRKEKKMNAITRATSIAVLVALGLTLSTWAAEPPTPELRKGSAEETVRISGVYPHLAVLGPKPGPNDEWGIGVLVPWAGKIWFNTYPSAGGGDLYSVDEQLKLTAHLRGVRGLGDRMIHAESDQLFIAGCVVNNQGVARKLVGTQFRCTAAARHLADPANKIYIYGMEGNLAEVDVHTGQGKTLFAVQQKGVTGAHGKGGYSGQGRLVVANNGGGGGLAEWDGNPNHPWTLLEKKQFCEVTGPGGIYGAGKDDDPIWATGWDNRSVILKVLDKGAWHTYRLPKASYTYDAPHGWFTEWPRIRELAPKRFMMDMHGMFYDFPKDFRPGRTGGLRPIATHLSMVSDWCLWNGRVVLARNDVHKSAQAQSNLLWFENTDSLRSLGKPSGWGGPWIDDEVKGGEPSDPFLIAGFEKRVLHLAHRADRETAFTLEVDREGKGEWVPHKAVAVAARGYSYYILPSTLDAAWMRIKTDGDCRATAYFHFSSSGGPADGKPRADIARSLTSAEQPAARSEGTVIPLFSSDGRMRFTAQRVDREGNAEDAGVYEVGADMKLASVALDDKGSAASLKTEGRSSGGVSGLPHYSANSPYDQANSKGRQYSKLREVVTERSLLNYQGTFYDVPIEGGILRARPISTHGKLVSDFCSWRGLLVLAGTQAAAKPDGHLFKSEDGRVGLWFGSVDDLWQFGKPRGTGGPWRKSKVEADRPSAGYMMTGFDRKRVELSHDATTDVAFTIEVDFIAAAPEKKSKTAEQSWHRYTRVIVPPGQTVAHEFPDGYSAHWVRLRADANCNATAWFTYE